jgi:DNA-binding transcriptional LysR family regulator
VQRSLADGRLKRVLEDWCQPYSGYHLYYQSRHQSSPALKAPEVHRFVHGSVLLTSTNL